MGLFQLDGVVGLGLLAVDLSARGWRDKVGLEEIRLLVVLSLEFIDLLACALGGFASPVAVVDVV